MNVGVPGNDIRDFGFNPKIESERSENVRQRFAVLLCSQVSEEIGYFPNDYAIVLLNVSECSTFHYLTLSLSFWKLVQANFNSRPL